MDDYKRDLFRKRFEQSGLDEYFLETATYAGMGNSLIAKMDTDAMDMIGKPDHQSVSDLKHLSEFYPDPVSATYDCFCMWGNGSGS